MIDSITINQEVILMVVNNITRLLDSRGIRYHALQLPAQKSGAEETARMLDVPPGLVYKSIVVTRVTPGKRILAVVPGDHEVNLKALAQAVGEKKVVTATQKEAEDLTGMQAGGISPLALINRGFEIVIDASALTHPEIYISGGERGLSLCLHGQDLFNLTGAAAAEISRMPR